MCSGMQSIPAHSDPLTSVDFAYDGTMILSSSYDGLVRLWDLETGRCLRTIIDEPNPPVAIARFTPNSRYLAIGTMDSRIDLWDYECQKKLKSYAGESENPSLCKSCLPSHRFFLKGTLSSVVVPLQICCSYSKQSEELWDFVWDGI